MRDALIDLGGFTSAQILAKALHWATMAALPFVVPAGSFGAVSILVVLEQILVGVAGLGQHRAVMRYIVVDEPEVVLRATTLVIGPTGCLAALATVVVGLTGVVSPPLFPSLALLAIAVAGINFHKVFLSVQQAANATRSFARHRLGYVGLRALFVYLLVFWFNDEWVAIGAYYSFAVAAAVLVILTSEVRAIAGASHPDVAEQIRKHLNFGVPLFPYMIAMAAIALGDRLLIDFYMDAQAVGVYTFAYMVATATAFLCGALGTYVEPQVYRKATNSESSPRDLLQLYRTLGVGSVAFFGLIAVWFFPTVVQMTKGPEYIRAELVLPALIGAHLLYPVYQAEDYRVAARQMTRLLPIVAGLAGGVNIVCNIVFIPRLGIWGAALATVLSYIVLAFGLRIANTAGETKVSLLDVIILIAMAVLVIWNDLPVSTGVLAGVAGVCATRSIWVLKSADLEVSA